MKRSAFLLAAWSVAVIAYPQLHHSAYADDAAPTTESSGASADKLVKKGALFLLPEDNDVVAGMKDVRAARQKVEAENKSRTVIEGKIKQAKSYISAWDLERRKYDDQLATASDVTVHNQLVAKINALTSRIKEAEGIKDDQESKLKALGETNRTAFLNGVLDLAAKADKAQKGYAELANDADVKATLEAAKPKGRLGPSAEFVTAAAQLKKWQKDITSDIITVTVENHVPNVEVTINGKFTREMVFDSGASMISLPADVASSMDLTPGPNDPIVHLIMADGKTVEAHQMVLKSVRVGTFTVEDVECAVLPPNLIAAQPLLGGTFLHNFIYKLDIDAGQLHLAQVGGAGATVKQLPGGEAKPPKPAGGAKPAKPDPADKDMKKPNE